MIRTLILAALLPNLAAAETLFVCDLQFYPMDVTQESAARLSVEDAGGQITATLETRYRDPAEFNCAGSSDNGGLECYAFFGGDRGSARQLNTFDAVPAEGTPVAVTAVTLSFIEDFVTPDGYDRSDLTSRRVATSIYQVTQCKYGSS